MGSAEWWGMLTQQVNTLSTISAENQQAMQQLLTKTSQMVSRQEMEDILEKRFMDRQESELVHKALERRVEQLESHQRGQHLFTVEPAVISVPITFLGWNPGRPQSAHRARLVPGPGRGLRR